MHQRVSRILSQMEELQRELRSVLESEVGVCGLKNPVTAPSVLSAQRQVTDNINEEPAEMASFLDLLAPRHPGLAVLKVQWLSPTRTTLATDEYKAPLTGDKDQVRETLLQLLDTGRECILERQRQDPGCHGQLLLVF